LQKHQSEIELSHLDMRKIYGNQET